MTVRRGESAGAIALPAFRKKFPDATARDPTLRDGRRFAVRIDSADVGRSAPGRDAER